MVDYKFRIVDKVTIFIRHFLMKRKDVSFNKIFQIMAHPQVFAQCQNNLRKKYPNLKLVSGKNEMIDTAKAAKALSQGKIDKNTAILGPKILSDIYQFDIVDNNLQDDKNNKTTFLLIKK
jgi:chorismate mutase/prephenate dehydratase